MRHGADPNIATKANTTPLYVSCHYGYKKCVLLLLQGGALVDSPDIRGRTPLYAASGVGQLKCGADVNKYAMDGFKPLIVCAMYDRFHDMSYLLAHGANGNPVNKKGI